MPGEDIELPANPIDATPISARTLSGGIKMPALAIRNVIPTLQRFAAHWATVNVALGGTPATELKLRGGYTLTNFNADITALALAFTAVNTANNIAETAAGNLRQRKALMLPRVTQFKNAINAQLPGSGYANATPNAPSLNAGEGIFYNILDDVRALWATVNADTTIPGFTPPILLAAGYTQATFVTDLAALKALYTAYNNSDPALRKALGDRDALILPLIERMKQYRAAVTSRFAKTDGIYTSLPRYSPRPGGTPRPVVEPVWSWDAVKKQAALTFKPSPSANLVRYELVYCPEATWNENNTQTLEQIPADAIPLEFRTNQGLSDPGDTSLFKIVTINETDNEKASKVIKVKVPAK